jgi:hypothetical protein
VLPARLAALTVVFTLALALPGVAVAQSDPFGPLPQQAPTQPTPGPTPVPPTPNTSSGGGLSGLGIGLIVAAGVILLLGIGWLIVRDARRRAPVDEAALRAGPRGSQTPHSPERQARARAKSKAARRQRKRNRARR